MPGYAVQTAFTAKDGVSSAFKRMGRNADRFGNRSSKAFKKAQKSATGFGSVMKGMLASQAVTKSLDLAKRAVLGFVNSASKIEDSVAAFTPIMKSTERASELVARLNKEAATTPFQFENIAGVAKQLLPVLGDDIEGVAKTFRMLGDSAGGNAQKLESITRGYTKALLKGRPDMEALNMIGEAGVPILKELAKTMGITTKEVFKMSSQGKLTNEALTKTFRNMTSEGGLFFKGMEIASKTFSGKMSTLKDNITLAAGKLGMKLFPAMKKVVDKMITLIQSIDMDAIAKRIDPIITKMTELVDAVDIGALVNGFIDSANRIKRFFQPLLLPIFNHIKDFMSFLGEAFGTVRDVLTGVISKFNSMENLKSLFGSISDILGVAIDVFKEMFKIMIDMGFFKIIGAGFKLMATVAKLAATALQALWKIAKPIIHGLMFLLRPLFKLITGTVEKIIALQTGIAGIANSAIGGVFGIDKKEDNQEIRQSPRQAPNATEASTASQRGVTNTLDINLADSLTGMMTGSKAPGLNFNMAGAN